MLKWRLEAGVLEGSDVEIFMYSECSTWNI